MSGLTRTITRDARVWHIFDTADVMYLSNTELFLASFHRIASTDRSGVSKDWKCRANGLLKKEFNSLVITHRAKIYNHLGS